MKEYKLLALTRDAKLNFAGWDTIAKDKWEHGI